MNGKTRKVLLGYFQLSDSERQEFNTARESYDRADGARRLDLRANQERVEKMDLGPVDTGCPCCGRR
jgi:hypothetical protein